MKDKSVYLDLDAKQIALSSEQFEALKKSGQLVVGISISMNDAQMHNCTLGTTINILPGMTFRKRIKWLLTGKT